MREFTLVNVTDHDIKVDRFALNARPEVFYSSSIKQRFANTYNSVYLLNDDVIRWICFYYGNVAKSELIHLRYSRDKQSLSRQLKRRGLHWRLLP